MNTIVVFVHCGADRGITEVDLPADARLADAHAALKSVGIDIDDELCIFVDEDDHSYRDDTSARLDGLKQGSHIHVCRCGRIATTVNYLDQTAERKFAPGTRVRRVKKWAVKQFRIEATDAGEHVLRVCGSADEPATDTPLHALTAFPACCICFDLVPEKRVEG